MTGGWRRAVAVQAAVAATLFVVAALAVAYLPRSHPRYSFSVPGARWLHGWAHWDSGWYARIADHGYSFRRGRQSSVAFFPLYPLLMRGGAVLAGSALAAGVAVTLLAGLTTAALWWRWLEDHDEAAAVPVAFALFLAYPYAYYLAGAVYADALFVVAVIASFTLLEKGHPVLAGLAGASATASRPIGLALAVGLALRGLEMHGRLRRPLAADRARSPERSERRWGTRSPWVAAALSAVGIISYCAYLWARFGDPFAFVSAERGWEQSPALATWAKVRFFREVVHLRPPESMPLLLMHPVVTIGALALLPRVFRRFGWGYGVYALLTVAIPALSSKDFYGMGRYLLAAFPCFAAAGELLAGRRRLARVVLPASALGLVVLTILFASGSYVS